MKVRNPTVIHYVHDMNRAKKFYMESFNVEALYESDGWTALDLGPIVLGLHILPAGTAGILPHAGLNLHIDNLDEMQADIERLGGQLIEIHEARGHIPRIGCFQDSEGNGFELAEHPSDSK